MNYFKVFLIIPFFLCANSVFAYDPDTTHAGITEQAVLFYNNNFSRKLSNAEKEFVISGSIAEDYPYVRVLNHFYDPIRRIGIYNYRTAKDWATDPLTENNYTWPSAIKNFAEGNDKDALIYLGHILHLIEDMTVPDHTRNDPHIGDPITGESTYEKWAKQNKDRTTLGGLSDNFTGLKPIYFNNILDFFDFLANYSNKNFFGDDSIDNNAYQYTEPKIIERLGNYGIGLDKLSNEKFKIIIAKEDNLGNLAFKLMDNKDTSVISGYFDRLSKQAILGAAGVIDLFFREAEKARAEYLVAQKLKLESEAKKALELEEKLSNSGPIGHALYDLQNLISENILTPVYSAVSSFGSNLANGSVIVLKAVPNLGNFVAFTLDVVAKEAYAETSSSLKSGYNKIISSLQNINSVISATVDNNPASVSLAPTASNEELGNPISKLASADLPADDQLGRPTSKLDSSSQAEMLDSLNKAMGELENLQKIALAQSAMVSSQLAVAGQVGTPSPSNAYVAGFGGGGDLPAPKVESAPEENFVDNSVDNLGNTQDNSDSSASESDNNEQAPSYSVPEEQTSSTNLEILFPSEEETSTTTDPIHLEIQSPSEDEEATSTEEVATTTEEILVEEEEVDTTAPDVVLEVKECADSMSRDVCIVATTTLNISWSSTAEDLEHFDLDLNGTVSSVSATSAILSLKNDDKINISVVAVDKTGNRSEKAEKTVEINLSPIIINEVAWNGTDKHSEDEWIELYNKTDKTISLDDWSLYSKTDNSPNIVLSGTIPPNGYYLIERKNTDETEESTQSPIKDIPADLWVSFGLGLNNSGENLILARASSTIDEVPYCANWCGASNTRTYERYSPESVIKNTSWTQNNGEIRSGKNTDGAMLYGTPKARNSANYLIPYNALHGNLELQKKNSPYFVPSFTTFEVALGETLTIQSGVVLKFGKNSMMKAVGNLITRGTADDPVVFTSIYDDEFSGDTNGDGVCDKTNASSTAVCPAPGNWLGVWILNSSTDTNIENTVFRYGGVTTGTKRAMVDIEKVSPDITGSTFEYALTDGLYLDRTNSILSGNTFRNNNKVTSLISTSIGLNISGGAPTITENKFTNNSIGLSVNGASVVIKDNEFSLNSVKMANLSNIIGGEISGNKTPDDISAQYSRDMINISGYLSSINSTTTLSENQMPYFVYGMTNIYASTTVEIKSGAKMMFSNNGSASHLYVDGKLIVSGTGDMPVVFSANDSTAKSSWQGINMRAGSQAEIKGALFKNAVTALTYVKSPIILEDTTFSNNKLGISADSFSAVLKAINVIFDNNTTNKTPAGLW